MQPEPTTFNIHAAKTHFSKLIERVRQGEDIVVAKNGKPVARLVPFDAAAKSLEERRFGTWKGQGWIADDFDDPLPEDFLSSDPLL